MSRWIIYKHREKYLLKNRDRGSVSGEFNKKKIRFYYLCLLSVDSKELDLCAAQFLQMIWLGHKKLGWVCWGEVNSTSNQNMSYPLLRYHSFWNSRSTRINSISWVTGSGNFSLDQSWTRLLCYRVQKWAILLQALVIPVSLDAVKYRLTLWFNKSYRSK